MTTRKAIQKATAIQVLTEAGYRCAVPTCRQILAIDIHHMVEVSDGGGNGPENLLPLCPTCHALHHRGTIPSDAIYAWKATIVSLSHAFDTQAIDDLLFLANPDVTANLHVSGDGVARFSRLIGAGLAAFDVHMRNGPIVLYRIGLTQKGAQLIEAWRSGNREVLKQMMGGRRPPASSNRASRRGWRGIPPACCVSTKSSTMVTGWCAGTARANLMLHAQRLMTCDRCPRWSE